MRDARGKKDRRKQETWAKFCVVPRFEGDFVDIWFPDKLARHLAKLKEAKPEEFQQFKAAIETIEQVAYAAGHRALALRSLD